MHRARRFSLSLRASFADVALPFLPLLLWILLFSRGVSLIPETWRPPINVTLLPWLDARMGSSLTWFGGEPDHFSWLDLTAAVPYTIHAVLPFLFLLFYALSGAAPASLLKFIFAFGLMNLAAVLTHLAFPTAPPWYFLKYGVAAANYDMKGDPAVLAKLDAKLGIDMYHRMYAEGGKIVFGAWPSLHAAWPYLMARFKPPVPKFKPLVPRLSVRVVQWMYVVLVWWAAIYLKHHYLIDLIGGVCYAELAYKCADAIRPRKGREFQETLPFFVK